MGRLGGLGYTRVLKLCDIIMSLKNGQNVPCCSCIGLIWRSSLTPTLLSPSTHTLRTVLRGSATTSNTGLHRAWVILSRTEPCVEVVVTETFTIFHCIWDTFLCVCDLTSLRLGYVSSSLSGWSLNSSTFFFLSVTRSNGDVSHNWDGLRSDGIWNRVPVTSQALVWIL